MDPVQTTAGPAGCARLGAEAMRQTDVPDRQLALVQQLIRVHPPQGDLGGAHQAEIGVLDRVDLGLDASGRESDPLQDLITGQVGGDDGGKPGLHEVPDRELLESQVQEHGVVLEEVEAGAGDLAAGLEVDQVEGLAQLDVILDRKVERAGGADLAELAAIVLRPSDRRVGMGQVRNPPQPLADLVLHHPEPLFLVADLGLEPLAFLDQCGTMVGVFLAAGGLGHLVLPAANLLDGREQPLPLALQRDDPIDVLEHVVRDVPVAAILPHRLGVGDDEFEIEHEFYLQSIGFSERDA